jgi:cell wall-associated NlpC family hydrolase
MNFIDNLPLTIDYLRKLLIPIPKIVNCQWSIVNLSLLAPLFLVSTLGCGASSKVYKEPLRMVVSEPVVNVRSKPIPHNGKYEYDPFQETQMEQGEPVLVLERQGDWVRIEAPEQSEFSHHKRWEGYPGWVRLDELTADLNKHHRITRLRIPENELRAKILEHAMVHLGNPYLWGGRSLHDPENTAVATGVDCSGLVNWSFRQVGWNIPRDSHEQFIRARKVGPSELKPADLFFLAKPQQPDKVIHVGFFVEGETLLEAPSSGLNVRKISAQDRFGKSLKEIKSGDQIGERIVYFGSFFTGE